MEKNAIALMGCVLWAGCWAGLGILAVELIGLPVYNQRLDFPALMGVGLIIIGTIVINLFPNAIEK
jgi:small multidrug resistance pump